MPDSYASRKELNGLGQRVTVLEKDMAVQNNDHLHIFNKLVDYKEMIEKIFKDIDVLKRMQYKMIGGVSAIVILSNIIMALFIAWKFN